MACRRLGLNQGAARSGPRPRGWPPKTHQVSIRHVRELPFLEQRAGSSPAAKTFRPVRERTVNSTPGKLLVRAALAPALTRRSMC